MTSETPLRVRIAHAVSAWHRAVVDAVARVPGVVVISDSAPADLAILLDDAPLSERPPLGVWRYGFGDGAPFACGAAGTIARLYALTGDEARAIVLHEGWFKGPSAEHPGTRSVGDRVAPWCARALAHRAHVPPAREAKAIVGCGNWQPPEGRGLIAGASDAFRRWRRRERWAIGVVPASVEDILERGRIPATSWVRARSASVFLADPFPLGREGDRTRLLAEEYDDSVGRGRIVTMTIGRDAVVHARDVWMEAGHHLSYPFVCDADGIAHCIPEAASTRRVTAYSVDDRRPRLLMDGFAAADATIVRHDGSWYLFCANRDDEPQTDLYIFIADTWTGPWRPHPLNPVKSDARSSRPAGAFFTVPGAGGALFRPAQDCSRRYGGGIVVHRIVALSPSEFCEEPVCALDADPDSDWPHGIHTLNGCGDVTWVDGLRVERLSSATAGRPPRGTR